MKPIMIFLCSFLFISLFSQSPCGLGYSFSSFTSGGGCHYTFTPIIPVGAPSIDYYEWEVSSYGTYGRTCDSGLEGNPLYYTFCFYGNHVVKMIIYFTGGGSCYVSQTIYVTCSNALLCNPDPLNNSVPDPVVEITYIDPATCGPLDHPIDGCMNTQDSSYHYWASCGWHWAIRIPENDYNCEYFKYTLEYNDIGECDDNTTTCIELTPGTLYCIFARVSKTIYILAEGNHCCLPANYKRIFKWTPEPNNMQPGIYDPDKYYSVKCADRCTPQYDPGCDEDDQDFYKIPFYPTLTCFTGNDPKIDNMKRENGRFNIIGTLTGNNPEILEKYSEILSNVSIIDYSGRVVFNGSWTFRTSESNILTWPEGLRSGIYIIRFENSPQKEAVKVFKID
jgi:hypothetical protein